MKRKVYSIICLILSLSLFAACGMTSVQKDKDDIIDIVKDCEIGEMIEACIDADGKEKEDVYDLDRYEALLESEHTVEELVENIERYSKEWEWTCNEDIPLYKKLNELPERLFNQEKYDFVCASSPAIYEIGEESYDIIFAVDKKTEEVIPVYDVSNGNIQFDDDFLTTLGDIYQNVSYEFKADVANDTKVSENKVFDDPKQDNNGGTRKTNGNPNVAAKDYEVLGGSSNVYLISNKNYGVICPHCGHKSGAMGTASDIGVNVSQHKSGETTNVGMVFRCASKFNGGCTQISDYYITVKYK